MKITDAATIKSGEQILINSVVNNLNWDCVKNHFKKKYNMDIKGDISYKNGNMTVYNNDIAYKLEFNVVPMSISISFDRHGNFITAQAKEAITSDDNVQLNKEKPPIVNTDNPRQKIAKTAEYLADIMEEINTK